MRGTERLGILLWMLDILGEKFNSNSHIPVGLEYDDLYMEIEDTFDIEIPDHKLIKVITISDLVDVAFDEVLRK